MGKEDQILHSLGDLMLAFIRIWRTKYPGTDIENSIDRLFAYQFGDGLVIRSAFWEKSLERCATIAIALMKHVATSGRFTRAAISEGQLADIQGCYPTKIFGSSPHRHAVSMGAGLMTITPVMGTALFS